MLQCIMLILCIVCIVCVLPADSLDFVLGVGFPAAALHLRWVQQTVLPDGVGPVAGQRLNHLNTHTRTSMR